MTVHYLPARERIEVAAHHPLCHVDGTGGGSVRDSGGETALLCDTNRKKRLERSLLARGCWRIRPCIVSIFLSGSTFLHRSTRRNASLHHDIDPDTYNYNNARNPQPCAVLHIKNGVTST